MLRTAILIPIFILCFNLLSAQVTLSGRIIDNIQQLPLAGVHIKSTLPAEAVSDEEGRFTINHAADADIHLSLDYNGQHFEFIPGTKPNGNTELIVVFPFNISETVVQDLPTITLDDDNAQSTNISGLLHSKDDLFSESTDYTFSPARFDRRGLSDSYSSGYINNLPINDLESGSIVYNIWGGLNDVTRQDASVYGANFADWGFGGTGTTFNTDLRASSQWKQKRISYAVTNRNYRNRLMGTWSTGLLSSGWAFSLSASRRWSQEGYIPGTYYDGYSYFASVDKKINDHHALNLVVFAAPYERGANSTSTQEMYDLAGDHYYNSFWGYQGGEKRNSRIYSAHEPLIILRHDWTISDKLSLVTSLGYQTGMSNARALDWIYAADPRPDYYRKLPSYISDPVVAEQLRSILTNDKSLLQLNWDQLYATNLNSQYTVNNVNGVEGETFTGRLSHYILEDRRSDVDRKTGNVVLEYLVGDKSTIHVGVTATMEDTRNYKELADLLGGEFYVDWDKYADQDFPGDEIALQNDLLRPNRIVREGDQFGYDYEAKVRQESAWVSYAANTTHWEIGLAGEYKHNQFWRDGKTQNGKFPNRSLGESEKYSFSLPSAKALVRYKLDGRNYITALGMMSSVAPTFKNSFVSPRTRDHVVDGLEEEKLLGGEIRYDLNSPYLKIGVSGFYITSENGIESTSFYHDDENTFVNFSLTGIDRRYQGVEAAVSYTLFPGFTLTGAASVGEYIYTSRPKATITQDNDGTVLQENIVIYAKNLYVSGTPQSAYTAGLAYRSKHFWSLYMNVNRFEEHWINFNPLRRTIAAVDLVEEGSEQWNAILEQEKVDPAWTVDLSFYKSWQINWPKDRTLLALNISVGNILNNEDYIHGGYEQYRFDFVNKDVNKFPSKYSYMQGLNYFVQGSIRF